MHNLVTLDILFVELAPDGDHCNKNFVGGVGRDVKYTHIQRVMCKIGRLESDNVMNMIKVRLHASRTHLSLPKMRHDNKMVAAATNEGDMASKRHSNVSTSSRYFLMIFDFRS